MCTHTHTHTTRRLHIQTLPDFAPLSTFEHPYVTTMMQSVKPRCWPMQYHACPTVFVVSGPSIFVFTILLRCCKQQHFMPASELCLHLTRFLVAGRWIIRFSCIRRRSLARRNGDTSLKWEERALSHTHTHINRDLLYWYPRAPSINVAVSRSLNWSPWSRAVAPEVSTLHPTWFLLVRVFEGQGKPREDAKYGPPKRKH